jgi:paraquat-inducible protein B
MATSTAIQALNERVSEIEQAIVEAVAEIDQTDSNRVALQETLDSVRETLADAYGDTLTDDVNEYLGIETVDAEIDEEDEEED